MPDSSRSRSREVRCLCGAFFFDPGEDGTPPCPVHQPKLYGAGEPERHAYCPDENDRCQHGDDLNCPALEAQ
jgi:hypothetical protein